MQITMEGGEKVVDGDQTLACVMAMLNPGEGKADSVSGMGTIIKEESKTGSRAIDKAEDGGFCKDSDRIGGGWEEEGIWYVFSGGSLVGEISILSDYNQEALRLMRLPCENQCPWRRTLAIFSQSMGEIERSQH